MEVAMRGFAVVFVMALAGAVSCAAPEGPTSAGLSGTIVDLSHEYSDQAIFWPTAERFRLEQVAGGMTPQGYYYAANNFAGAEHGGTHVDAPVHFAQGRWSVEQIPLEQLIGAVAVVDVSAASASQPDYQVPVSDLEAWEKTHGSLDGMILLIRTDYSTRWPDAARYLGTAERGEAAVPKLHFPGLHPDAARWLVDNRKVKAVGIDTASIDYGQSTLYETHRVLYERNIPGLENLANLNRLPARGATLIALPMKIKGGSGGPLRAVAILPPA
jgi:kynurenine formamidase